MDSVAAALGGQSGDDGAEKDGEECAALDQRIAGGQFLAGEMVGQNAVFDRAEQRSDHAVQEHGEEQERDGMDGEAADRDRGDADLQQLQAPRDRRLVVAVGQLAAEAGEKEEG